MASNGDMKAHIGTYTQVTGMLKWSAIVCFFIAAAVVWLIA